MSASTQPLVTEPRWIDRLIGHFYNANMSRTVTQLRIEANSHYRELISDLDTPLDSTFESLVAESFNRHELVDFRPSDILFPRMMIQFGTSKADYSDSEIKTLSKQCDQCHNISQCWLALRGNAEIDECEQFCPNADVLIARAS